MTEEEKAKGCFTRLAILFGLFWLGAILVTVFTRIDGNGGGFEIVGSIFPILFFFLVAGLIRRRIEQSKATARKSPRGRPTGSSRPKPTPPIIPGRPTTGPGPSAPPTPPPTASPTLADGLRGEDPSRPIPELPPIEAPFEPGELPAFEALELADFEPPKPMSSEERLRQAREKYMKKG